METLTMKASVFVPVVKLGPDPIAYHHPQVFIERNVTSVEDAVNVSAQQNSIRNFMNAPLAKCHDVRRI
jgi:hypothetical protein